MQSSPSDTALLAVARRRPEEFAAIFDRYFDQIYRFAAHRLDVDAADDIAAETFIRAFAARERVYTVEDSARSWLFAIANNLIRDEWKRRRHHGAADDAYGRQAYGVQGSHNDGEEPPDPELVRALGALREDEHQVLALYAWADLTYEEIAAAVGSPIGTVRSRLSRARSRLKLALDAGDQEKVT